MLIDKSRISELIPQREPFIMIDELLLADQKKFVSSFEILDHNIFLENAVLSESALVENMAQTCAAGLGYVGQKQGKKAGGLGFIGAVTRLTVTDSARKNDKLDTRIELINTFDSIHLVQGEVRVNGKELIQCQMKIVVT